jgi:hypothetical protein
VGHDKPGRPDGNPDVSIACGIDGPDRRATGRKIPSPPGVRYPGKFQGPIPKSGPKRPPEWVDGCMSLGILQAESNRPRPILRLRSGQVNEPPESEGSPKFGLL